MTTDTSERGLERVICTALTGHPCDPPKEGTVGAPPPGYGGVGWSCGNPYDYDREYCVDLVQLTAFLRATQLDAAEALDLDTDGPTRLQFLARLQGGNQQARDDPCATPRSPASKPPSRPLLRDTLREKRNRPGTGRICLIRSVVVRTPSIGGAGKVARTPSAPSISLHTHTHQHTGQPLHTGTSP